ALALAGHALHQAIFTPDAEQTPRAVTAYQWLQALRQDKAEADTLEVVVESDLYVPWNLVYDQLPPDDPDAFRLPAANGPCLPFRGPRPRPRRGPPPHPPAAAPRLDAPRRHPRRRPRRPRQPARRGAAPAAPRLLRQGPQRPPRRDPPAARRRPRGRP